MELATAVEALAPCLLALHYTLGFSELVDLLESDLAVFFAEHVAHVWVFAVTVGVHLANLKDNALTDGTLHVEALGAAAEVALDACTLFHSTEGATQMETLLVNLTHNVVLPV